MAMTKLLYSSSFDNDVGVGLRMVEDPAQLRKSASTVFACDYSEMTPDKDHVGLHVVALGDAEHFGCFFAGAPVQTANGQVAIEKVKVGDLVLTHTGKYKPVTAVFKTPYEGDRITIAITGMPDDIECTPNHPVQVVRREGLSPASRFKLRHADELAGELQSRVDAVEWAAAETLRPGDYLVINTEPNLEGIESIPAEFDPYVLGFYVAEGCLVKEYRDISTQGEYKEVLLTGSTADLATFDYIDAWLARLGRNPGGRQPSLTSDLGIRYSIFFKELAGKLDTWFGHLATDKRLPSALWTLSKTDRLRFLAGYFDGDGCLQTTRKDRYYGTLTASTASRSLALDVQRLLASVGIPSSVTHGYNSARNGCFGAGDFSIYSIGVGSYYSRNIIEHCLRHKSFEREFTAVGPSSMQLAEKYALVRVSSITRDSVTDTYKYNLEVADDNSYVVDVIVHNSNRNFDLFPKEACEKYHHTFVKNGHVFEHHRNKDPERRLGQVIKSAYDPDSGRIELFIHAHKEKAAAHLEKLARDGEVPLSMACRVPGDFCTKCGAFRTGANDPNQCEHISNMLGHVFEDGVKVGMINKDPTFFDISFVTRPADRIAWTLKAASDGLMTSVKLAELEGIEAPDSVMLTTPSQLRRYELMQKLAGIHTQLRGIILNGPKSHFDLACLQLCKCASYTLTEDAVESMRKLEPADVFTSMAKMGSVLGVDSFYRYALGPAYLEVSHLMPAVRARVPGVYNELVQKRAAWRVCADATFNADHGQIVELPEEVSGISTGDILKRAAFRPVVAVKFVVDSESEKRFNGNNLAGYLAEKYAAYKVAALDAIGETNDEALWLAAVQDVVE